MMRKITKFFLFLLVGLSLAGCILNFGGLYLLQDTSDNYNKRDLRHWLSLQARVEALEEAADGFAPEDITDNVTLPLPAETVFSEPSSKDTEISTEAAGETGTSAQEPADTASETDSPNAEQRELTP